MLFNSFDFVLFFLAISAAFFLLPHRLRWILLLAGSYFFYMYWRPDYVVLILATTLVAWLSALAMERTASPKARKACVATAVTASLGLLFTFKYFNFFNTSLRELAATLDVRYDIPALEVLLPVGISFYTFQTLSYTVDVYRGQVPVEPHLGRFALYVSFFPQLVAGPIERASRLLPQFDIPKRWETDRVLDGLRTMLWGFFKKMVIADNLARYVEAVYANPGQYGGASYLIATYFFAFQIYCDFSGYTDIARGAARILGFDLMENFRAPYLAQDLTDFWRRWHISLSTWLRDYLYIPLGGNRGPPPRRDWNLLITMLLGGLWHGANWTFLAWGALHGLFLGLGKRLRKKLSDRWHPAGIPGRTGRLARILLTFHFVCLCWIFFRAPTIAQAWDMLAGIVTWRPGALDVLQLFSRVVLGPLLASVAVLVAVDVADDRLRNWWRRTMLLQPAGDMALALAVLIFGRMDLSSFIYFQF